MSYNMELFHDDFEAPSGRLSTRSLFQDGLGLAVVVVIVLPLVDCFAEDQLLQKDAGFERGISDATTTTGAELPELEDLEDTPCKLEEGEYERV